jgi:c(7)-type cytochrome triheme protein
MTARANTRPALSAALVWSATLLAAAAAWSAPPAKPAPKPAASVAASKSVAVATVASVPVPVPVAPSASTLVAPPAPSFSTGYSPLATGAVPKAMLPPGADSPDPGPSRTIYPNQRITIRFNHRKHVKESSYPLTCKTCHGAAATSTLASDRLLPTKHEACTGCHKIDEKDPFKSASPVARCDGCHLGVKVVNGAVDVPKVEMPNANLKMSHKAHLDKAMTCEQCHGDVGSLELATRDQLPRMKGCFTCHQGEKPGTAKGTCATCHVTDRSGKLQTMFASGVLSPPDWLKGSRHDASWIDRHKRVAGLDSGYCANCHQERECTACHDAKTRPRSVHPNDWLSMHAVSARFDAPKCQTCHSAAAFCTTCHVRAGVAMSSPSGVATGARFHPPAATWSAPARGPGHHAMEAQKNINACVSCHVERDCAQCHATRGANGRGVSPHGADFVIRCQSMYAKNARPCFVCHEQGDKKLEQCK